MTDEWVKDLVFYPPYHKNIVRVDYYYDVSRGRLVKVEITDKPNDLTRLKEWLEYRKSIGKPVIAFRTYLSRIRKHAIGLQIYSDMPVIFITLDNYSVYVKRTALSKSRTLRTALRYVLTYSGYKLRYKRLNTKANRIIITEQKKLGADETNEISRMRNMER